MLDNDESTVIDRDVISTQIGSLVNETEKCSKEDVSHSLDQTEHAIEPKEPLIYENKVQVPNDDYEDDVDCDNDESEIKLHETIKCSNEASSPNFPIDDYEDGVDSDNDESEIKLQEIYVLSLAVIGVILFGAVFGMLLTSLGFNTQIGNVLEIYT